jgi:hypothetical protein
MSAGRWAYYLAVFGLLAGTGAVVIFSSGSDSLGGEAAKIAPVRSAGLIWESPDLDRPAIVHADTGRIEVVHRVRLPEVQLSAEPVVDPPPVRVKFGDDATVRFALRDNEKKGKLTATIFHLNDDAVKAAVRDAGDGTVEVPFTPSGPGQFDVVLSDGGVRVASRKVGVVGIAGSPGDNADPDFLSVDPREARMRTAGKVSRR